MSEKKKTILIVEDEAEFRLGVRMRLEASGYNVIEAPDGAVGLEMARNQAPDLVLLDLMLPRMDGYQFARLLKFDERHRKIPIVVLTARSQSTDRQLGMEVGADAYIIKPFKREELLETIAKLLAKPQS